MFYFGFKLLNFHRIAHIWLQNLPFFAQNNSILLSKTKFKHTLNGIFRQHITTTTINSNFIQAANQNLRYCRKKVGRILSGVSRRTIYRDMSSLEQAGIPIIQIDGKGYGLMDGYRLPPIMFTEEEANALIFGEKMIAKPKTNHLLRNLTKQLKR